jgi:metal-responsive CopG/Arc/MetJ family transcriptional regulator
MREMKDQGKRIERLQIMLSGEELSALDDWRFDARMPSRSAAVRELLRRGLSAEGYYDEAAQGSRSKDFSILDGEEDG